MGKLYHEISMSLDGFVAGPNTSLEQPLGEGGERLHEWATGLESWRESHGKSGGRSGRDDELMQESIDRGGAVIMGRNMFGPGPGPCGAMTRGRAGGAKTRPSTSPCSSSPTTSASRCG